MTHGRVVPLNQTVLRLLYAGLLLLPFSSGAGPDSVVVSFGLPFLTVAGMIVLVLALASRLRFPRRIAAPAGVAGLYTASLLAASIISPAPVPSFARAGVNALGFLLFLYVVSRAGSRTRGGEVTLASIWRAMVMSGCIMASYYIVTFGLVAYNEGMAAVVYGRYMGGVTSLPWGATNVIAASLIIPLVLALQRLEEARRTGALLPLLSITVMSIAIFLTMSRTAIAVLLMATLMHCLVHRSLKAFWILCVTGGSLLLLLLWTQGAAAAQLVYTLRIASTDITSLNGRFEIWQRGWTYFLGNPLSPIGYYASLRVFGYSSHNILLNTLLEQGITGLLATGALFAVALRWSCRRVWIGHSPDSIGCPMYLPGMFAVFVNLLFEDANFTQQYIVYFWLFVSLLFSSTSAPEPRRADSQARHARASGALAT